MQPGFCQNPEHGLRAEAALSANRAPPMQSPHPEGCRQGGAGNSWPAVPPSCRQTWRLPRAQHNVFSCLLSQYHLWADSKKQTGPARCSFPVQSGYNRATTWTELLPAFPVTLHLQKSAALKGEVPALCPAPLHVACCKRTTWGRTDLPEGRAHRPSGPEVGAEGRLATVTELQ